MFNILTHARVYTWHWYVIAYSLLLKQWYFVPSHESQMTSMHFKMTLTATVCILFKLFTHYTSGHVQAGLVMGKWVDWAGLKQLTSSCSKPRNRLMSGFHNSGEPDLGLDISTLSDLAGLAHWVISVWYGPSWLLKRWMTFWLFNWSWTRCWLHLPVCLWYRI